MPTSLPVTRLLGGLTAAYSAALFAEPALLLRPCNLPDTVETRALARCVGARDTAIGLAMVISPAAVPRRTAVLARVASDWDDAVVLGLALRSRGTAVKVAAFAGVWGALCAAAGVRDELRLPA